jgi:hypothetical protein
VRFDPAAAGRGAETEVREIPKETEIDGPGTVERDVERSGQQTAEKLTST